MENLENQEYSKDKGSKRVLRLKGFTLEILGSEFKFITKDYVVTSMELVNPVGNLNFKYLKINFEEINNLKELEKAFKNFIHTVMDNSSDEAKILQVAKYLKEEKEEKYYITLPCVCNNDLVRNKTTLVCGLIVPKGKFDTLAINPVYYKHFKVKSLKISQGNTYIYLESDYLEIELKCQDETWTIEGINIDTRQEHLTFMNIMEDVDRSLSKFRLEDHYMWLKINPNLSKYVERYGQIIGSDRERIIPSPNEIREEKLLLDSLVNRMLDKVDYYNK